ncbi:MAG: selenocysteine-specific translation elongation factor, partial [Deltaproteobacteria bacterium]
GTSRNDGELKAMDKFITAGVAGHVDHGKTMLVRCLTGSDMDRLKEEKHRGLSIEPSIAPLQLPSGRRIALVDVPGHRDFLKNTIRGLSNVDIAILVVAADDGVMPQTRDHLEILNFLEAKGGFIVLSKTDVVDHETVELAEMEIREIVQGSFLEGQPVIPFSGVDGRGLDQILHALECAADRVDGKTVQAPFRLWVDQVRNLDPFGTVVTGTVRSGIIKCDDTVQLLPSGKETHVRFIEVHHERVEQAVAGQRAGLNLSGISLAEISRGTVLAAPGILGRARLVNAELSLLPTVQRPILDRRRFKLHIGTCCTTALLVLMEKERFHPGETALAQFRLQEPLAVLPRDPFVISPLDLRCVLGGGKILETPKEKFRAANAEKTLAYLRPLQRDEVKTVVSLYASKFPNRPVTAEEIVSSTGFSLAGVQAAIRSRMRTGKLLRLDRGGYFVRATYEQLKSQSVGTVKKVLSKDGSKFAVSRDEIRFRLNPDLDTALFERMLSELCKERKLMKTDEGYRIPNLVVRHPAHRKRLLENVVEFAKNQGNTTFSAGTFWKLHGDGFAHKDVETVLDHLHTQNKLVRLNDDRFLATEALEEIKHKVTDLIRRKGSLSIHDCREIFGYGRTRALPILDYLDDIGLTSRMGDVRVLMAENPLTRKQGRR